MSKWVWAKSCVSTWNICQIPSCDFIVFICFKSFFVIAWCRFINNKFANSCISCKVSNCYCVLSFIIKPSSTCKWFCFSVKSVSCCFWTFSIFIISKVHLNLVFENTFNNGLTFWAIDICIDCSCPTIIQSICIVICVRHIWQLVVNKAIVCCVYIFSAIFNIYFCFTNIWDSYVMTIFIWRNRSSILWCSLNIIYLYIIIKICCDCHKFLWRIIRKLTFINPSSNFIICC